MAFTFIRQEAQQESQTSQTRSWTRPGLGTDTSNATNAKGKQYQSDRQADDRWKYQAPEHEPSMNQPQYCNGDEDSAQDEQ